MLISVIIPCFNVEGCIVECLDSVFNQSYKNLEVICIDDGSTDQTFSMLQEYARRYLDKFIILQQSHQGASSARNKGLYLAKGDYVQFLDADDLLMPTKIEHQVQLILKTANPPDFIIGACKVQDKKGVREVCPNPEYSQWVNLITARFGNVVSNLWKANFLKNIGGWDNSLESSQEYDLLFRGLCQEGRFVYDQYPLAVIRQIRTGRISSETYSYVNSINMRAQTVEYLRANNLLTPEILFSFRKAALCLIRAISNSGDTKKAYEYFNKYLPYNFPLCINSGASLRYRFLYFFCGFLITEKIIKIISRVLRK